MKLRQFGNTDLEVSEICFGPMRFAAKRDAGGEADEGGDDVQSVAGKQALRRALERGVNFIHSSYEYGTRWALGEALREYPRRADLHHIIKVPVPDFDDDGRFDAAKFRLRVEEALRDLHAEHIAVIQHLQRAQPNEDAQRMANIDAVHPELLEVFGRLRDEGKVGYLTTFPYSTGFARAALATDAFSGLVAYYNAIEMEMTELFPSLQAAGRGFLCIRPFMAGLLTNERADREQLPADDRMREPGWSAAYQRLATLRAELALSIDDMTTYAIQLALAHPIVSSLIVGLNTPQQVDEAIDAAESNQLELTDFERARAIFIREGALG